MVEVEKTIKEGVGVYSVEFLDDQQKVVLKQSVYHDGVPVRYIGAVELTFEELQEKDPEAFALVAQYIQDLCDGNRLEVK